MIIYSQTVFLTNINGCLKFFSVFCKTGKLCDKNESFFFETTDEPFWTSVDDHGAPQK